MKNKSNEYSWSEFLDKNKKFKLYSKYVLTHIGKIEKFAVILLHINENEIIEILRFDGNLKEMPNVHKFYLRKNEKLYLNKDLSWETIEFIVKQVKNDWRTYALKYKEKYKYNF